MTEYGEPYVLTRVVTVYRGWNPDYPQDELCRCGHEYLRHFDSYMGNYAIGCKYCPCRIFVSSVNPSELTFREFPPMPRNEEYY